MRSIFHVILLIIIVFSTGCCDKKKVQYTWEGIKVTQIDQCAHHYIYFNDETSGSYVYTKRAGLTNGFVAALIFSQSTPKVTLIGDVGVWKTSKSIGKELKYIDVRRSKFRTWYGLIEAMDTIPSSLQIFDHIYKWPISKGEMYPSISNVEVQVITE